MLDRASDRAVLGTKRSTEVDDTHVSYCQQRCPFGGETWTGLVKSLRHMRRSYVPLLAHDPPRTLASPRIQQQLPCSPDGPGWCAGSSSGCQCAHFLEAAAPRCWDAAYVMPHSLAAHLDCTVQLLTRVMARQNFKHVAGDGTGDEVVGMFSTTFEG